MKPLSCAALALATTLAACAAAEAQEFRHRGWAGARLPGDKDSGCAMGLDVRGGALVVYANAAGGLRVGIGSRELALEPGKEAIGAATFDDSPPILLKGSAISANTVLFDLMEPAREGALGRLVEASRGVKLTYGGRSLVARLSGSERAIKLLRDCAAAPDPIEALPPVAEDAPAAQGERAAGFGFLRQGMEIGEADAKLLDAGWQSEPPAAGDDAAAKPLRDRGVTGGACSGEPATCVLDYADAYGNSLRLTTASGDASRLRGWRLNPPGEGPRAPQGAGPDADPPAAGERGP